MSRLTEETLDGERADDRQPVMAVLLRKMQADLMLHMTADGRFKAVEYRFGRRCRIGATPSDPGNSAAGESVDWNHDDTARCLGSKRGCRHDGSTVPISRQRGEKPHPVDLGLRSERHAML